MRLAALLLLIQNPAFLEFAVTLLNSCRCRVHSAGLGTACDESLGLWKKPPAEF
jgi:hypothetical protein